MRPVLQLNRSQQQDPAGATVGRQFSFKLIAGLAERHGDLDAEALPHLLQRLLETDLLTAHGTLPNVTYTFKHALTQEVAYEGLLLRDRQVLHGRVAKSGNW